VDEALFMICLDPYEDALAVRTLKPKKMW
jgi:hypothetical protein